MGNISLKKGQAVSLSKGGVNLTHVRAGLGWDVNENKSDYEYDLDASVFLLKENGCVRTQDDFIFYNNLRSKEGTVEHMGDNLTGGGDGDDEVIKVNLEDMPSNVNEVVFVVTMFEAEQRKQNFGQVENAFIRIVDENTNKEVCRFDLTEDYSACQSIIVGSIKRDGLNSWKFKAIGDGQKDDLMYICKKYGVSASYDD